MPELPEVQTTVDGIRPYLEGNTIERLVVRERRLRWPVEPGLEQRITGMPVSGVERRAKYILVGLPGGGLIIHLGMSGSMRVLDPDRDPPCAPGDHDHFDLVMADGFVVRFRDPRRFGCLLYHTGNAGDHPRLRELGVEPLGPDFHGELLYTLSRSRSVAVKQFIMDGKIVVGVGNIYAVEALFDAGIHPHRNCSRISRARYGKLSESIKGILRSAINEGGTTLQDFVRVDGVPGYFEQSLAVYGRERERCPRCDGRIRRSVISQRSTYYCPGCQT